MARIKGGLNAKKKHNRVLKMAKGYRGARSKAVQDCKAVRNARPDQLLCRQKREKETVQTAVDCPYQRCSTYQRPVLQQVHVMA